MDLLSDWVPKVGDMFLRISVELGDLRPRQPRSIVFGRGVWGGKKLQLFCCSQKYHGWSSKSKWTWPWKQYIYTYVTYCNTYIVIIILKQIEYWFFNIIPFKCVFRSKIPGSLSTSGWCFVILYIYIIIVMTTNICSRHVLYIYIYVCWLVVSTPLKNMSSSMGRMTSQIWNGKS